MRACGGTWIAHGSGSADRETVDGAITSACRRPTRPTRCAASGSARRSRTATTTASPTRGSGRCATSPSCARPSARRTGSNTSPSTERFADAVIEEARREDPIVLVQDYHFALLPRMVRERLPNATIMTFWHIPWPNSETFGICPWKEEIVHGLLGSTILGFHTQFHCNNFLESDRPLRRKPHRPRARLGHGRRTRDDDPAVSDFDRMAAVGARRAGARRGVPGRRRPRFGLAGRHAHRGRHRALRLHQGHPRPHAGDRRICSVRHPSWKGRLVFLQAAAPTRSKLAAYGALQKEAERLADEINARHGTDTYQPIVLVVAPSRARRGVRAVPRGRRLHRLQPARRHEPGRQGVRRRPRRRAGRAHPVDASPGPRASCPRR